jgi:hypothetical protein
MEAYVEIIREDGTLERTRVEGEQITVGRAATAGIALPDARDLEPEHMLIAPRGDGCWVAIAQGAKIGAKVGGQPFQHGMVAWGAELEIGNLRFRLTDKPPQDAKSGGQQVSPVVIVGAIGAVLVVLWSLSGDSGTTIETEAPEAFVLFQDPITCPATVTAAIEHRATEDASDALARSERYPFDPADGVDSVRLYRTAAACYAAMSNTAAAADMQREGDYMQHRIEEDYRTHRVRLERSIELGNYQDALLEARSILAMISEVGGDHPYVGWLTRLERQLELELTAPGGGG